MRSLYKSVGLASIFFVPFAEGTQVVFANPHAVVKSYDTNKPDEQDELVKHCLADIKKYWDLHISILLKGDKKISDDQKLDKLMRILGNSEDVDKFLDGLIQKKECTLPKLNKKFQEYYDLAMKDKSKRVDCRIVSSHVLSFLRSKNIKSYVMSFETELGNVSHDVVIYAVLEKGEENWYVCDMENAKSTALKILLLKGLNENLFEINEIVNLLKYPLIDYVNDYVPSFECFIYDDTVGNDIIGKSGYTDEYWILGEFVKKNCTKEYQKKFLVDKLTSEERSLLDADICNISYLEKLAFRPYERQNGPIGKSGLFYNKEKTDLTFLPQLNQYGRFYSLKDALTGKNYENVIYMLQQSS